MTVPDALKPPSSRWAELLQTLQEWPWRDTARTLAQRFREDRLGLTASSLTFTTLIALVPLFTVMLAVFSAFPMFSSFQGALEKYFVQALVPDGIARPVLQALVQFSAKAKRLGGVGLVVLLFTAIALTLTIDRTLNAIWRVRRPRPFAQRVLVYWAAVTLGPLVLGVSLTFTSYALSASQGVVGRVPGGVALLLNVLEYLLLAFAMAALFRYVPNTLVRWRHAVAGGVFVSTGIEVAKKLLAWYVASVPGYSVVYGAFATVPIFLVWLYLSWVVVLFGAVIAAYAPSLQLHVTPRRATPGYRFELAVGLLRELATARGASTRGAVPSTLARRLRADPLQVEPLIDLLCGLDWVARLDESGEQRVVLLAEPDTTPATPLLAALLLEPSPTVRGFWQRASLSQLMLADLLAP